MTATWDETCASLDLAEPGWRWPTLLAQVPWVPEQSDARQVVLRAAAEIPATWAFPATDSWQLGVEEQLLTTPANIPLLKSDERRIAAAVDSDLASALREAEGLEVFPAGPANVGVRPAMLNLPLDTLMATRRLTAILRFEALKNAVAGDGDAALRSARRILGCSRAALEPPCLMSLLVTFACRFVAVATIERILAWTEPSAAALRQTREDLEPCLTATAMIRGLQGERALVDDLVQSVASGATTWAEVKKVGEPCAPKVTGLRFIDRWIDRWRNDGNDPLTLAMIVQHYTELIGLFRSSPHGPRASVVQFEALQAKRSRPMRRSLSSLDAVMVADRRSRAVVATAVAGLSAEIAKQEGTGTEAMPTDPFDLQPLRVQETREFIRWYSVGQQAADSPPRGAFFGAWLPGEISFRIWKATD